MQTGEPGDNIFLMKYTSYTDPSTFLSLNFNTLETSVFFQNKALTNATGYNASDYTSDYITYKNKDGTDVPLTIIRKKSVLPSLDHAPEKPVLTHMYAYGGFGSTEKPTFNLENIIFFRNLQGIQVIVHTRGGGEKGEDWHKAGEKDHR